MFCQFSNLFLNKIIPGSLLSCYRCLNLKGQVSSLYSYKSMSLLYHACLNDTMILSVMLELCTYIKIYMV